MECISHYSWWETQFKVSCTQSWGVQPMEFLVWGHILILKWVWDGLEVILLSLSWEGIWLILLFKVSWLQDHSWTFRVMELSSLRLTNTIFSTVTIKSLQPSKQPHLQTMNGLLLCNHPKEFQFMCSLTMLSSLNLFSQIEQSPQLIQSTILKHLENIHSLYQTRYGLKESRAQLLSLTRAQGSANSSKINNLEQLIMFHLWTETLCQMGMLLKRFIIFSTD